MNESNGDVIMMDEQNALKTSTYVDMLLAEIGQLERMIEKKQRDIEFQEEIVDSESEKLEGMKEELDALEESKGRKQHQIDNPNFYEDETSE